MPILHLTVASGQLSVRRFVVDESVSSLFTVGVWAFSELAHVDLEGIIGKEASLVAVHGVALESGVGTRTWKGVCTHVEQVHGVVDRPDQKAVSTYFLRIAPKAWLLTQRRNHRIFQYLDGRGAHMTIPDILDKLLKDWGIFPVWKINRGSYPKLEYKVQYGETDYVFMSRIAEEAGLCFTFPDEAGSNITFWDALDKGDKRAGPPLPYVEEPNQAAREYVTNVRLSHDVRPGAHVIRDYDFRNPSYNLRGDATPAPAPETRYEQFHYQPNAFLIEKGAVEQPFADDKGPIRNDQPYGQAKAERALLGRRVGRRQVAFDTNEPDLWPGLRFNIGHHPHPEIGDGTDLLVLELSIDGSPHDEWTISGQAVFTDMPYRPPLKTPKAHANNVQSAVVVGPPGEEIHVDEFGRVRVQFPWDREGTFDDYSSCWIRVSQGWAGTGYGMIVIPRVGQEVLIGFLEGDPDNPVVVGRVFNATQVVPYTLPEHKTRSTWKSNSSKGGDGFNEIMFEDLKQKELVWMQAQKNLRKLVKHDETITIGHDRQKYVVGNETETTGLNRTEVTGVNRTEITGMNRLTVVGQDLLKLVRRDEYEITDGKMMVLVRGDQDIVVKQDKRERVEGSSHLKVSGKQNRKIDGKYSLTVGKDQHIRVDQNHALDVTQDIHLKAGSSLVVEATEDLTLKGPGGFIRIDASGVTIVGTVVRINSGGSPGSAADASPEAPDEAKEAQIDDPVKPIPENVLLTGVPRPGG